MLYSNGSTVQPELAAWRAKVLTFLQSGTNSLDRSLIPWQSTWSHESKSLINSPYCVLPIITPVPGRRNRSDRVFLHIRKEAWCPTQSLRIYQHLLSLAFFKNCPNLLSNLSSIQTDHWPLYIYALLKENVITQRLFFFQITSVLVPHGDVSGVAIQLLMHKHARAPAAHCTSVTCNVEAQSFPVNKHHGPVGGP